jgi:hypothetical protein
MEMLSKLLLLQRLMVAVPTHANVPMLPPDGTLSFQKTPQMTSTSPHYYPTNKRSIRCTQTLVDIFHHFDFLFSLSSSL